MIGYRTSGNCGAWDTGDRTDALTTGTDPNSHLVAHSLRAEGCDAGEDGTGRGVPLVANVLTQRMHKGINTTLDEGQTLIAGFDEAQITSRANRTRVDPALPASTLASGSQPSLVDGRVGGIGGGWIVRRLTPRECERLQGFPDDHTLIDYRGRPAADGPRYRAIGNSMAVNVMDWIGGRLLHTHREMFP